MRKWRALLAVSMAAWVAGCNDSPRTPTGPSPPSASPGTFLVSGVVTEMVDGMSRPLADRSVWLWVSQDRGGGGRSLATDHDGRYSARVPKSRVFATSLSSDRQQPCVATVAVDKDATLDVQVVPSGSAANPPTAASPLITGVVYETTQTGRIPVRRALVALDESLDNYVAWTYTDDEGHFFLCRVNVPLLLGVAANGYQTSFSQRIAGTSDLNFEIELKR
jgi:hypothetical protein